jgi:hypothetical protein
MLIPMRDDMKNDIEVYRKKLSKRKTNATNNGRLNSRPRWYKNDTERISLYSQTRNKWKVGTFTVTIDDKRVIRW